MSCEEPFLSDPPSDAAADAPVGAGGSGAGGTAGGAAGATSTPDDLGGTGGGEPEGGITPLVSAGCVVVPANNDPSNPAALSDEFDAASTVEGRGDDCRHQRFDVNRSRAGHLVLTPDQQIQRNGWFNTDRGPLVYQLVSGDFVVEARVTAARESEPSQPPVFDFANAGLLIRRPPSDTAGEAWVKYDIGFEDTGLGRAVKSTVDSASEVFINYQPSTNVADLRICLLEGMFSFFYRVSAGPWQPESYGGPEATTALFPRTQFDAGEALSFPSLAVSDPSSRVVQVGLFAGFRDNSTDVRGEFDYVRFGRVETIADCTAPLPGDL